MKAVAAAMILSVAAVGAGFSVGTTFKLRLLHTNDMHARFEQVSRTSGKCSQYEAEHGLCYGGFARVKSALDMEFAKAEREAVPVLSLNAGDTYQGTVWYAVYKWRIVLPFLKMLPIDAMSLGNHEFDDGIKGLTPFLKDVGIPVLAANLNCEDEDEMCQTPLKKSMTLERGGKTIGIIGYLTPETIMLANTGKVKFRDEIETLKEEAKKLKASGADIIFALGHSGYEMDLKIAAEVPEVDVVVGGHSHTFLYSGKPPDSEVPLNTYPVMVTQPGGRKVAMVQAFAFTKYLGILDLTFDEKGELMEAKGNPILLNKDVPEDKRVLIKLKEWQSQLNSTIRESIGTTKVYFDGFQCRFLECNSGNLITDAYIHHAVKNHSGQYWTPAAIAIQQGGGIRAPINATGSNGTLTREDIIITMPFFSPLGVVKIKGKYLLEALEWSVARYDPKLQLGRGEFLQVSGLKVRYDIRRDPGSRVVSLKVRCADCFVPTYESFQPDADYVVIMPTFLLKGGDNFMMFKNHGVQIAQFDESDTEVVIKYIQEMKILYTGEENRIEVVQEGTSGGFSTKPSFIYFFLVLFIKFLY